MNLPAGMTIITGQTVRAFLEIRARPGRLCLLLIHREHSQLQRHAPALLRHGFLPDGAAIDVAFHQSQDRGRP